MIINVSSEGSGGSIQIIKSPTQPSGIYSDGTVWFNTSTGKLYTYITDAGFVPNAPTLGLLTLNNSYSMPSTVTTAQNFTIPTGLEYQTGDIFEVKYEGLTLVEGDQYSFDTENDEVTLLGFTVQENDLVSFTINRIVDATAVSSISDEMYDSITRLDSHISSRASATNSSHVILSDTISESDVNSGIAATPKAVYESRFISDENNTKYRFGIENGILYLEEV